MPAMTTSAIAPKRSNGERDLGDGGLVMVAFTGAVLIAVGTVSVTVLLAGASSTGGGMAAGVGATGRSVCVDGKLSVITTYSGSMRNSSMCTSSMLLLSRSALVPCRTV